MQIPMNLKENFNIFLSIYKIFKVISLVVSSQKQIKYTSYLLQVHVLQVYIKFVLAAKPTTHIHRFFAAMFFSNFCIYYDNND